MTYHPERSTHRALAALSTGPMSWEETIAVIDPKGQDKARHKLERLRSEGLVSTQDGECWITATGRHALECLDEGLSYPPFRPTVRRFDYQGRGVGA